MATPRLALAVSPTGTFGELNARDWEVGLLELRSDYCVFKTAFNFLLAGCYVVLFLVGDSWWKLVVAVALAGAFVERRVRPIVKQHCAAHKIPYHEVQVWASCAAVARFFGKVSRRARLEAVTR